jgi:hypothetical protein
MKEEITMQPLIITGPQGAGKSENSHVLQKFFQRSVLVDPWEGGPLPAGCLALTNATEFPEGADVLTLEAAMAQVADGHQAVQL